MQALMVVAGGILGHGDGVDDAVGSGRTIDDGSGSDADFRRDLGAAVIVGWSFTGLESPDLPEFGASIGVECVDGVVLGGDDEQVVGRAVDWNCGKIERLGIDGAVDFNSEQLAEGVEVHVAEGERGLGVIESGVGVVIVVSENVLREGGCCEENCEQDR